MINVNCFYVTEFVVFPFATEVICMTETHLTYIKKNSAIKHKLSHCCLDDDDDMIQIVYDMINETKLDNMRSASSVFFVHN